VWPALFCSIEIAGERPSIASTSGFSIKPQELASVGGERLDVAPLSLRVNRVEREDDFPDPDSPVMTVRLSRGISTVMSLRLCSRAPRTTSESLDIDF